MSVTAYLGVPGSGKSLHVMDDIYWTSKRRDSLVLCNFDVSAPKGTRGEIVRLPFGALKVGDVLEPTQRWLDEGHVVRREGQILVVIDEAQITFSNRDWNAPGRMDWIRFFIQHRKLGMRVILVVQDLGMIDKQIRAVVEATGNHMKVNSYGTFGLLVTLLALGRPVCMCVYRLPFYGSSKNGIIGREAIIGRKRLYRMYDTHAMFSSDMMLDGVWSKDG